MRLIFFGTPESAVPSLETLLAEGHEIPLVVTQPDRPKGRSGRPVPSPVKVCAEQAGLGVFQPVSVNTEESLQRLRELGPELFVVVAFGQIFRQPLLDLPKHGCVNLHFSLLPRHRGAAPVQHALLAGDEITGVSTMSMDPGLDTGDVIFAEEEPIHPEDTTQTLTARLAERGARLLARTVRAIAEGTAPRSPQDGSRATQAPMLKPGAGELRWDAPARRLCCVARALAGWPGCVAWIAGRRVRIWSARLLPGAAEADVAPGTILDVSREGLRVRCGEGDLLVIEVQPEGRNRMDAYSFANGYRITAGHRFSPGPEGSP